MKVGDAVKCVNFQDCNHGMVGTVDRVDGGWAYIKMNAGHTCTALDDSAYWEKIPPIPESMAKTETMAEYQAPREAMPSYAESKASPPPG